MEIFKFSPAFKQYIWGGNNLKTEFGKDTPEPPVAESWEVSAHKDGLSVVSEGTDKGKTIPELIQKYGKDFYGNAFDENSEFPLLLKILDAQDKLSVQVHPDDDYAFKNENGTKGKNEAWYILKAEEGAKLIYGFKEDITKADFEKAIEDKKLGEILNSVDCNEGDVFYIPAGTVHAVGKGLIIAEIQQSSNNTYRVYDYDRRDKEGNLRELHVEKAIAVSDFSSSLGKEKTIPEIKKDGDNTIKSFVKNKFFCFDEVEIEKSFTLKTENTYKIVFVAEGKFEIDGKKGVKGDSFIVPACISEAEINGTGKVLVFYQQ